MWALVVFHKGKRIEKLVEDPRPHVSTVKTLRERGAKAHLIPRRVVESRMYPPEEDDMSAWKDGKWWCPYCGDWRFFSVPRWDHKAEIMSDGWFLNIMCEQRIQVCQWCRISEQDWYVKAANDLFGHESSTRKRRKSRSR